MKRIPSLFPALFALGICFVPAAPAFQPPARPPLANFDRRHAEQPAAPELPVEKLPASAALKTQVSDVQWRVDKILGAPNYISARSGFLSGPGGQGGAIKAATAQAIPAADPHRAIKGFLNDHSGLLGFDATALNSAVVQREHVTPHNGMRTVVWAQQVDGIPVFDSILMGHITKNGELVNLTSHFVPDPTVAADAGTKNRAALQAAPTITAAQALAGAAQSVGDVVAANQAASQGLAVGVDKRQSFTAPALKGPAETKLVWLPTGPAKLRLCWQVVLTSRSRGEMFLCIVDAMTGEVVLRRCLTNYISDASYRVFTSDSPSPFSPGHPTPLTNQPAIVPRVLVVTNAFNTNASPNGWINDGDNETRGNNVDAHTDLNDDDQPDLPRPQGNPARVFDFPLNLASDPTNSSAAAVVQLFYWCNFMHDKLYELGFTEAAGNFQVNNFGRGGQGNDAVLADAQDGGGVNNANMSTQADGTPPRMQMYIFDSPTPHRDGSLDAEVILHEYTHGLSNRRVGGGVGINSLQSSGMGEGWSDFYGLSLLSEPGDNLGGNFAVGGFLTFELDPGFRENYYYGIRRYPYSTNLLKNPLTFKDIDPTQASAHAGIPISQVYGGGVPGDEVHAQGEVWCVTLWQMRANLVAKHGFTNGNKLALQLVTDGMTLSPVDPNFLQARDAIIQADLVNNAGANYPELWAAFARRGMGGSATSPDSSTTVGVVEAFDLPGLAYLSSKSSDAVNGNANGVVDINECVNLDVVIRNGNFTPVTGVTGIISSLTPGVIISENSAPYSNLAGGAAGTNLTPYKIFLLPSFVCGTPIEFSIRIVSAQQTRTNQFVLPTGGVSSFPVVFANATPLPIPDFVPTGVDSPVAVSGVTTPVGKVVVSLHLTHPFDSDLVIKLIGPDNTTVTLSDSKGGNGDNFGTSCSPNSSRTTFDDAGILPIASGRAPFVGTFRPDQTLSAFKGKAANGVWRLHIADIGPLDVGTLQCWSLTVFPTTCTDGGGACGGDIAVSIVDSPDPVLVGSNLTYTITVTNNKPFDASAVVLTNVLPAGTTFVSVNSSQGNCTNNSGTITCTLGLLAASAKATVTLVVKPTAQFGSVTNTATVATSSIDVNTVNNSATAITTVNSPVPLIVAGDPVLTNETGGSANGGIETGETVTLNFGLRNIGTGNTTNLTATLLAATGITSPSPGGPVFYGVLLPGGAQVSQPFTFTASGAPGSLITATFQLFDGGASFGTVSYNFILGSGGTFANPAAIVINDANPATPYPSTINVSGLTGVVSKVTVTLTKFAHSFPDDVDVLLVGPHGEKVMLMSDAGGDILVTNKTFTFDSSAVSPISDNGPLVTGTFLPADYEAGENLPAPAPAGPAGTSLDLLKGINPNGVWSLYVADDTPVDGGVIAGGWSLAFNTIFPVNPNANLAVAMTVSPGTGFVGGPLTYTLGVTNFGPNIATNVVLTDTLPAGVTFNSAIATQGSCVPAAGTVTCTIGTLAVGAGARITVVVTPTSPGARINTATATSGLLDLNLVNNTATLTTAVNNPVADLAVLAVDTPDPALTGGSLTYAITVTNQGPNTAFSVLLTNVLPTGVTFVSAQSSQGTCSNVSGRVLCTLGNISSASSATIDIVVTPNVAGTRTAAITVTSPTSDPNLLNNQTNVVTTFNTPVPALVAAGSALFLESFAPANSSLEPGETVTINLALRNVGTGPTANLVATLQPTGGVTSPGAAQNFGVVQPGGPSVFRPFTFTASGTNGGTLTATLQLQDGAANLGTVSFIYTLSTVQSFANNNVILIPDSGAATPYPASITVAGLTGTVSKATVNLTGVAHTFPEDIRVLLVGPTGQKALLMANCGGGNFITNVNLTFDDTALTALPFEGQIVSGTNQPTVFSAPISSFPAPAPAAPYASPLAAFKGTNPNGTWSLYVLDDAGGDLGRINGGWSLTLVTASIVPPAADLSVTTIAPGSAAVGGSATFVVTVTNHGPSTATGVVLTDTLPAGLSYVSGFSSLGSYNRVANVVTGGFGTLAPGAQASVTIVASPGFVGYFTNSATATAVEADPNPANNLSAKVVSAVGPSPLQFTRSGNVFIASWPAAAGFYLLESTPNLSPPVIWTPVAAPVSVVGGLNFITNHVTGANLFLRLRAP